MHTNSNSHPRSKRYGPDTDGIDHINIHYNHAHTRLGKLLSHFCEMKFEMPEYGWFQSIEGFWWWYNAGGPHFVPERDDQGRELQNLDKLRSLSRQLAKTRGKNDYKPNRPSDFRQKIKIANYAKITQNEELRQLMVESELPFTMYYLEGKDETKPKLPVNDKDSEWLLEMLEEIRKNLKEVQPNVE